MTRRRPAYRLTSALVGAIVAAVGVLTIALLSGRELDTELIAIIALAAIGGWLLITALLAGRRPRSGQWAAVDEPSPSRAPEPSVAGNRATATTPGIAGETSEPPPGNAEAPLTAAARKSAAKAKRVDSERAPKNP